MASKLIDDEENIKDEKNSKTEAAKEPKSSSDFTLKMTILVLLSVQNAAHALLSRYSKGILKETYSGTEVVLVGEVIKLFVSGYLAINDTADTDAVGNGWGKIVWLIFNSKRIIVLVVLYSLANILTYYALARVEASVYSVLLQLKILTTAFFAVLLLGRNISLTKWRALFLLVLGCVLVASPAFNSAYGCDDKSKKSVKAVSTIEYIFGVVAVLVMVSTSGYSSIYFEGMLKKPGERLTIWERNFQLALYSCVLLFGMSIFEYSNDSTGTTGLFQGWTITAVLIAFVSAAGGLLVAATLKYADAVLKTLATSASIVMSTYLGYYFLNGPLDIFVSIGAVSTILAIFNYTLSND